MTSQDKQNKGATPLEQETSKSQKKPYHAPVVKRYGRIQQLTLALGNSGADTFGKNPSQMRLP